MANQRNLFATVLALLLSHGLASASTSQPNCSDQLLPLHPSLFALNQLQSTGFEELTIKSNIFDHFLELYSKHKDWRRGPEDKSISPEELEDVLGGLRRVRHYFELRLRRQTLKWIDRETTRLMFESEPETEEGEAPPPKAKPPEFREYEFRKSVLDHPDVQRLDVLTANVIAQFTPTYIGPEYFHRLDREKEGVSYFIATTKVTESSGAIYRFSFELDGKNIIVDWPRQGGFSSVPGPGPGRETINIQFIELEHVPASARHGEPVKHFILRFPEKALSSPQKTENGDVP